MTSEESFLTRAPMTPSEVSLRYSKGRDLDVVLRNGYRKRGMCAGTIVNNMKPQNRAQEASTDR
jgi:hypothetical protein